MSRCFLLILSLLDILSSQLKLQINGLKPTDLCLSLTEH